MHLFLSGWRRQVLPETRDLLDLTDEELDCWLKERGYPRYRRDQILAWVFDRLVTDFEDMTNVPRPMRSDLSQSFHIACSKVVAVRKSADDAASKLLILLEDGQKIETVIMRYRYGISACVSSQVGCKIGCAFCASGASGFVRDLTAGEMVGQVLAANRSLGSDERVSSIVVMGMGEPLDNFDALVKFMELIHDSDRTGIGYRRITVSTSGLVPKILELASLRLPVTLAVSLHAPDDLLRNRLVPLNRVYPVSTLIEAAGQYAETTGRRVTFEYALIRRVNDSDECARSLARLIKGMLCHVNLIPLNPVSGIALERSDRVQAFHDLLQNEGIDVTIRRELGIDIDAACGQLRRRHAEP